MNKAIAIDPGLSKCGLVVADIKQRKVNQALVIKSNYLLTYVKRFQEEEDKVQFLIGNGTSSQKYINTLNKFIPNLIIANETNSTVRAKERFFEIFPIKGLKNLLPREIFLLNKNLDALAALVIMEDYYSCKFEISRLISTKTWLK